MTTEANKDAVRRIYAALENGDPSVFGALMHQDCVWRFPSKASWSRRFEGLATIRAELFGPLFALFADKYTARAINLIAEGDTVVAEIEGRVLTHAGGLYDNQYCMLFHFRDGMIVEVVEYCDTDLEERVLGPYPAALEAHRAAQARAASA